MDFVQVYDIGVPRHTFHSVYAKCHNTNLVHIRNALEDCRAKHNERLGCEDCLCSKRLALTQVILPSPSHAVLANLPTTFQFIRDHSPSVRRSWWQIIVTVNGGMCVHAMKALEGCKVGSV